MGLKLHEDWGTTPAAIDNSLTVAEEYDIQVTFFKKKTKGKLYELCIETSILYFCLFWQVNIHTDTLNESGFVEHTIAAFKGRTIHAYHRYRFHLQFLAPSSLGSIVLHVLDVRSIFTELDFN